MANVHEGIKVTGLSQADSDRLALIGWGSVHPDFNYQDMKTAHELVNLCKQWNVQRVIQANGGWYRVDPMRPGMTQTEYDALSKQLNENCTKAEQREADIEKRINAIVKTDKKSKAGTKRGTFSIDWSNMWAVVQFNNDCLPWQEG